MRRLAILLLVCTIPVSAISAKKEDDDAGKPELHKWRISLGGISRSVNDITFHTGTRSSASLVPKQASSGADDVGAAGGIYDNGYVLADPGTATDGDTWYWGYDSAEQIQGDTLSFSGDAGFETKYWRDTSLQDAESINSDETTFGPILQFDYFFARKGGFAFGVLFNASYITLSEEGSASTFSDEQRWDTYSQQITDVYDLMGVIPPAAPYDGTYAGPGPLLPTTPSSRTLTTDKVDSDTMCAWNEIQESFDFDMTTLSLGVGGEHRFGAFVLSAAVGPTLNVINMDSTSRETLYGSRNGGPAWVLADWSDSNCDQELKSGLFVQAGFAAYVFKGMRLNLLGRYDWTEEVTSSVGPTEIEMDLNGFSAMATVSWDI